MRLTRYILFVVLLFIINHSTFGQDKKFVFNGYLSNMQTVMYEKWNEDWLIESQFHNRLNFRYYANEKWTFDVELRNGEINISAFARQCFEHFDTGKSFDHIKRQLS